MVRKNWKQVGKGYKNTKEKFYMVQNILIQDKDLLLESGLKNK